MKKIVHLMRHIRKTHKKKKRGEQKRDSESKENEGADFTIRMEAKERSRRQKLERKRGEKEYEQMIDKKVCPKCGAIQSYDEVVSRRNKCKKSGCNCLYRKPGIKDNSIFLKRDHQLLVKLMLLIETSNETPTF